jgi:hypothetical protein
VETRSTNGAEAERVCTRDSPMSGVAMSRCSIDLKPSVRGKGSLTEGEREWRSDAMSLSTAVSEGMLKGIAPRMNPEKKKLI